MSSLFHVMHQFVEQWAVLLLRAQSLTWDSCELCAICVKIFSLDKLSIKFSCSSASTYAGVLLRSTYLKSKFDINIEIVWAEYQVMLKCDMDHHVSCLPVLSDHFRWIACLLGSTYVSEYFFLRTKFCQE